jgi:hypothetical protein
MEQYYYSSATGQTYSAYQMQALFGINVETTDISILNLNGFYPVIETQPDFDIQLYSRTVSYTIVGTDALMVWTAAPLPLPTAIVNGSQEEIAKANAEEATIVAESLLSTDLLTAVSGQEPIDRPARFQDVLDAMGAVSDNLNANLTAIEAATSVDEIDSIIHRPTGIIVTGRGGASSEDMQPSYFTDLTNLPPGIGEPELEIYIPGTDTVIPYDAGLPAPFRFDSAGECYNVGDYRTTIRVAATGQVLSTVTPAAGPAVPIAWTYNPTIPPAPGGGSEAF